MNRPVVLGVAALILFAFGVLAANTHIAQGIITVTAYEADVNKDAHVNVADLGLVASKYGQVAPTATPTPLAIAGIRFPDVAVEPSGGLTLLGQVDQTVCHSPVFHLEGTSENGAAVYVYVAGQNLRFGGSNYAVLPGGRWSKIILGTDVFGDSQSFGFQDWILNPVAVEVSTNYRATFRLEAICPTS